MKKKQRKLSLSVEHEEEPEQAIELNAFLFSRKQELLEIAEVKDQKINFKTKVSDPSGIRILILPDREQISERVSIEELKYKYNAYEPVIRLTEEEEFHILPIPRKFNDLWFLRTCRVRGSVSKYFDIHGIEEEKPLCNVRVHICEVDRLLRWLPRIPDDIIVKIPDIVFNPDLPIPQPIPDLPRPVPRPEPDPVENIFEATDRPVPKQSIRRLSTEEEAYSASEQLQGDESITTRLLSYEPNVIRDVVRNNFDLFHPLLCYVPWIWPYFYRCDEIAVEYTNINGLFDTEITYWLLGDKPDLYFWVEAKIDGVWTTVYKPPISCNTYWNYDCGDEIDITVTDPRVQWECPDVIDGEAIWVKTVGHRTSVHHIQQTNGAGSPIQGVSRNRIGLTDTHESAGDYLRPFGQRLYFLLQFSSGLPKDRYTYYRWSYRKIKNADLSNATAGPKSLDSPMNKQYSFEYRDSSGDLHFDENTFKLGPYSQGGEDNLYLIPPASPYDPPVNATETNAFWDQNTKSIAFDSELEGDGLYEFTLELFDDSGNKITDIPNELFQIPHYDDFSPSINAPSRYLSPSGPDTCDAFKMVMRIDNQQCEAEIYKLEVDGTEADPGCCGFVSYADEVNTDIEISFRAFHPNNFATFNFEVQKGNCGLADNADGFVISGVDGYTRSSASVFSQTFSPNDLLGSCANEEHEGKAAFAQSLKVHALTTNGNHVINGYDSPHRLAAFALEPDSSS